MKLLVLLSVFTLTIASPTIHKAPSPRGYVYTPLTPEQVDAVNEQIANCIGYDDPFNATLVTDPNDVVGMRQKVSDFSDTLSVLNTQNQKIQATLQYQTKVYDNTFSLFKGDSNPFSFITARAVATATTTASASGSTATATSDAATDSTSDPFLSTYSDHMAAMGIVALQTLLDSAGSAMQQTMTQLMQMQDCAKEVSNLSSDQIIIMKQAGYWSSRRRR